MNMNDKLHVISHPLVQHKLSILRSKDTNTKDFRELVSEIAMLMCYEATRDLPLQEVTVETPLATMKTKMIDGKKMAVVPILRAGLGMADGVLHLMPAIHVGHIGLYRDPTTQAPVEYYCKMPDDIAEREVLLVDPLLATGDSAAIAIQFMKDYGCTHIKLMNILVSPQGVKLVMEKHPDVDIYCAAVDEGLNDKGYIIPGLGDAGDRIFGTK